jgi:hypothetical protein
MVVGTTTPGGFNVGASTVGGDPVAANPFSPVPSTPGLTTINTVLPPQEADDFFSRDVTRSDSYLAAQENQAAANSLGENLVTLTDQDVMS